MWSISLSFLIFIQLFPYHSLCLLSLNCSQPVAALPSHLLIHSFINSVVGTPASVFINSIIILFARWWSLNRWMRHYRQRRCCSETPQHSSSHSESSTICPCLVFFHRRSSSLLLPDATNARAHNLCISLAANWMCKLLLNTRCCCLHADKTWGWCTGGLSS